MHKVIILIKVRSLFVTQSLGLFPIHVPILVFARLKDSLPPIYNIFTGKILLYSQRFILGGLQCLCLFKDCRKKYLVHLQFVLF